MSDNIAGKQPVVWRCLVQPCCMLMMAIPDVEISTERLFAECF